MRWSALSVLAMLALAGCSNPPASPSDDRSDPSPNPGETLGLEVTKTTGLLVGYVVDVALRPLANVSIEVTRAGSPALKTSTTEDGAWGLDGLDPGTYVVQASVPQFLDGQAIATVRADVADPEPVRLVLERDRETVPYVVAVSFEGFVTCGVRGGTGGVHCGTFAQTRDAMADRSQMLLDVEAGPSWIQAELLWDSTQPLADQMGMYLRQVPEEGNDAYMGIYPMNMGRSPLLLAINATGVGSCSTCVEAPFNMTRWGTLQVDARSGELSSTTPPTTCSPTGSPCVTGLGFTLNQRFQLFVHVVYRATPAPGWQFSVHGDPLG